MVLFLVNVQKMLTKQRCLKAAIKTQCFSSLQVDGSYSNWSLNSTCNVTCGEGFETWTRECNNPEPKYGGRNCSHLGEPVEYTPCSATPCPGKSISY
jgi:hypothetical protein